MPITQSEKWSSDPIGPRYKRTDYAGFMSVRRGLSPAQQDRVRSVLRRRLARHHGDNLSSLARELGIAQSSLWEVVHGGNSPSRGTVEALAKNYRITR